MKLRVSTSSIDIQTELVVGTAPNSSVRPPLPQDVNPFQFACRKIQVTSDSRMLPRRIALARKGTSRNSQGIARENAKPHIGEFARGAVPGSVSANRESATRSSALFDGIGKQGERT